MSTARAAVAHIDSPAARLARSEIRSPAFGPSAYAAAVPDSLAIYCADIGLDP